MPVNYLLIERLQVLDRYYGDTLTVEVPTGSGRRESLWGVATDLSQRLLSLFRRDPATGLRPQHGANAFFSTHPRFRDLVPFYEVRVSRSPVCRWSGEGHTAAARRCCAQPHAAKRARGVFSQLPSRPR